MELIEEAKEERTTFQTGAVRDAHQGKGRFDLLPWTAIMEVAKHCERGALHYGERNVDKGIPIHSLIDSGIRHICKFWLRWEDEPHLTAACWNLLWALEMMMSNPLMDDRPGSNGKQAMTNGDHIRSMSDEELEAFINSITNSYDEAYKRIGGKIVTHMASWLKEERKE